MQYAFNIVSFNTDSLNCVAHFQAVSRLAVQSLAAAELNDQAAWSLCEYIDAVDAGDIDFDRAVYRQAVAALGEYLQQIGQGDELESLMARSWAAHTLGSLLQGVRTEGLRGLRAA